LLVQVVVPGVVVVLVFVLTLENVECLTHGLGEIFARRLVSFR
jgi:hypothetical protein